MVLCVFISMVTNKHSLAETGRGGGGLGGRAKTRERTRPVTEHYFFQKAYQPGSHFLGLIPITAGMNE